MENNHRVACLYRVSTKRQMEENDIPMQKNACRAFIAQMDDWELVQEYTEKGVSGYHKSAGQRDMLKQARHDAKHGLFNILLVFMFDRLGRREDETPFVVEWFVSQGVAVWSVKEGQQRFDTRVDKLLNYIRFWQSGGESEKTSIRVKEKHRQMVTEGLFRGGSAAFGYRLTEAGYTNNKGYPLKKLIIDEMESEIVRTIFQLAAEQGYGGRRIAQHLNERMLTTKNGNAWSVVSVMDLLKNPLYMGRYVSGRRPSGRGRSSRVPPEQWIYARETKPELAIVSEAVWQKAASVRASRFTGGGRYPRQTKGLLLLTGLAYCGVCGARLTTRHAVKSWVRKKDGAVIKTTIPAYRCPGQNGITACNGQKTFSRQKIDPSVLAALGPFFSQLPGMDIADVLNEKREAVAATGNRIINQLAQRTARTEKDLALLRHETMQSLRGESSFSTEQLADIMQSKEKELAALQMRLSQTAYNETPTTTEPVFISDWNNVFRQAPLSAQKMLLTSLLRKVCVGKEWIKIYAVFDLYPVNID